jgi:hypothetical protein
MTNLAVRATLAGHGDPILSDELNHASKRRSQTMNVRIDRVSEIPIYEQFSEQIVFLIAMRK